MLDSHREVDNGVATNQSVTESEDKEQPNIHSLPPFHGTLDSQLDTGPQTTVENTT